MREEATFTLIRQGCFRQLSASAVDQIEQKQTALSELTKLLPRQISYTVRFWYRHIPAICASDKNKRALLDALPRPLPSVSQDCVLFQQLATTLSKYLPHGGISHSI